MAYTAWQKVRELNKERFGIDAPKPIAMEHNLDESVTEVERECIAFIREMCEDLRFDQKNAERIALTDFDGGSVKAGMIPYNMEKDIDRLCLENAIHRFMKSGVAEDAFDVYFCYLEMFVGEYARSKKMIEMLAEFEANASSLLMKHRDHYSHSVYVFVTGLAIYHANEVFRLAYQKLYDFKDEKTAAHSFLNYWGLTSLFHDIGYPFELPFEQVKSYFGNTIEKVPFVAYKGLDEYIDLALMGEKKQALEALMENQEADSLNDILAYYIAKRLENAYADSPVFLQYKAENPDADFVDYIKNAVLSKKPSEPQQFGGYMDHAYFSAVILLHQLLEVLDTNILLENKELYMDALTAIILHNSMYKFSITDLGKHKEYNANHRFKLETHPLAYMLMLCDELQCWDRTSYGQNSRRELHAMDCDIVFNQKRPNHLKVTYLYDEKQKVKSLDPKVGGSYKKMTAIKESGKSKFLEDIEEIIQINEEDGIGLDIEVDFVANRKIRKTYLSNSNFIHLYNFAVALNARHSYEGREHEIEQEQMEKDFNELSLEYKLSNLWQAKAFAKYLNEIGCFYTDRPVAYELVTEFTQEDMNLIGPLEHDRWMEEKLSMGWTTGDAFKNKQERELTRTSDLLIPYKNLSEYEQGKDVKPMMSMLKLIEQYDGLRIYRLG